MRVVLNCLITWRLCSDLLLWLCLICCLFARTCLCLKVSLKLRCWPRRWLFCINSLKNNFQSSITTISNFVRLNPCLWWLVHLSVRMLTCLKILCWWERWEIWTCLSSSLMMCLFSKDCFRICSRVFVPNVLVMRTLKKSSMLIWRRKISNTMMRLSLMTKSTRWSSCTKLCLLVTPLWLLAQPAPVNQLF